MSSASHGAVAVVGARGFLGQHVVRALRTVDVGVHEYSRERPVMTGDRLDDDVRSAATVVWAASSVNPLIASQHPELVAQDREQLVRFLDALERDGVAARVVLLSSGGTVYGDAADPPFDERCTPRPQSEYGSSKLALERVLREHAVPGVTLRVANAYGPGQPQAPGQGVVGHWLRALRDGRHVTVYGPLDTVRDYVYAADVADAVVRVHGAAPGLPPVLNVGSGEPTTLAELVDVIHDVVPDRRLEIDRLPARPFDLHTSWLDVSLADKEIGWRATTPLREGVAATWQWLVQA